MKIPLDETHPDVNAKPGDTREYAGRKYVFGENQFTSYWRAGPKNGTIICSKDYPHGTSGPYIGDGTNCATFEKAADRANSGARREYEKAKAIVERYEAAE